MVSINATAEPFSYSSRTTEATPPLERSRRLNTVLLVIIAMLLMFGALGGTYLYSVVSGLTSTSGAAGANGAPGSDGVPGVDGSDGSDGTPGPFGENGSDGKSGSDGADGLDGAAGADGIDGAPGADGADGVTLYNSGQGVVDLGTCDSDVRISVRSRLEGDLFFLTSITLSDISSNCSGSVVDVYALGGTNPNWMTLTEAIGVPIAGDSLIIDAEQLSDDSVLSSDILRIALEVR